MASELVTIARKKSQDPAQEQLRQAKDDWNLQVKQLIALLIPFKRGMNGVGDAKAGIPPSNIKAPLPSQIGHYLNEISSRYNRVIEDAQKIIDIQTQYSNHRRKSQNQTNHASYKPMLVSEASWWGSQAWARVALLGKIDRKIRIDMLGSGIDVYRNLKNFESEILNYKNPDSIPNAVRMLAETSLSFNSVFLRLYNQLLVL